MATAAEKQEVVRLLLPSQEREISRIKGGVTTVETFSVYYTKKRKKTAAKMPFESDVNKSF